MRSYLFLLISLLAPLCHAEVNTYLSRYTIAQQETVRLTIEVTHQEAISRPDLSGLGNDFVVVGSKKVTISNRLRSGSQATTRWQILLRPRKSGEITIAPIAVHGESSLPLTLKVIGPRVSIRRNSSLPAPEPEQTAPAALMQTEVEHRQGYEGSEFHYIAKFLHQAPLSNDQLLRAPYLDKALILENGTPQEEQVIYRGQPYYQTLYRYLIYPDSTEENRIEPPRFTGTSTDGTFYDARGETIKLDVLPRPQNNSRGYWLPADRLELSDSFQQPERLEPGSTLIRTLTLQAFGLPAERLPSLAPLQNELAELTLLDTDLSETFTPEGLISTRVERVQITVKERGEVTLPPIDIYWWDTYEDRGKVASLAPVILRVAPSSGDAPPQVSSTLTNTNPAAIATGTSSTTVPQSAPAPESADTEANTSEDRSSLMPLVSILVLISIISSLGWLYTFNRLKNRAPKTDDGHSPRPAPEETRRRSLKLAEHNAYSALAQACQNNQVDLAKIRLIDWAQRFWPEAQINNCEGISKAAKNQTLDFLIIDLEQHFYRDDKTQWQGDLLLQAIETLRRRRKRQMDTGEERV